MRIASATIINFRGIADTTVSFASTTTFIGPNGSGKSTVLRALDWFFNGDRSDLDHDDIFSGSTADAEISVEVTFDALSAADRKALGPRYIPEGVDHFTAKRTWCDGEIRTTGQSRSYTPFDTVRSANTAAEMKTRYTALSREPGMELDPWRSRDEADRAMLEWESNHRDLLEASTSERTHFFGFNGKNVLSGVFDFVLISADLRASEETIDGRQTVVGRILERSVSRSDARGKYEALARELAERQRAINTEYLEPQLTELALVLNRELHAFARSRDVLLRPSSPLGREVEPSVTVSVVDESALTSVDRQGHGFQRALLIAALKLLAQQSGAGESPERIFLAIEEPELFQHPSQAQLFAHVLQEIANEGGSGFQVACATHSPYFVDPDNFDQLRRVTRAPDRANSHAAACVFSASKSEVLLRVESFTSMREVISPWNAFLKRGLSEALFADLVVLVEGETDKAVLDGVAARTEPLERHGIVVAIAGSKRKLIVAHAILTELGIDVLVVFDGDRGVERRSRNNQRPGQDIDHAAVGRQTTDLNRNLLRYLSLPVVDFPNGWVGERCFVFEDRLEEVLMEDWPEWDRHREELVAHGDAGRGKNAASYWQASRNCPGPPPGRIVEIIQAARAIVNRSVAAVSASATTTDGRPYLANSQ